MDSRTVARAYALGRAGLGAALVAAPEALGRPWLGDAAAAPGGRVALQALGVRDLAIGAVALHVAGHEQVAPRWMAVCAACDAVDLAATLSRRRALPPAALGVAALAAAGALTGAGLARALSA